MSAWTLVGYRTPAEPSTARVTTWRALHRLGALYLGPSVCVLPEPLADRRVLEEIGARVTAAGGSFELLGIGAFEPEAEELLRARFSAARAEEYAQVVERAEAIVAELEREAPTFAEVEENEGGVAKLRAWLRRVVARDQFGCPARVQAEAAVSRAAERLEAFVEVAMAADATPPDDRGPR